MKTIDPALKTALASGNRCFLLKITGRNNVVYGFTNHDKELTYETIVFKPTPGLKHLETYYSDSAEVSTSKFKLAFVDIDEDLVKAGVFDNSEYEVWRIAWDNLSAGHYEHDKGRLAGNKWDENKMEHETHSFERDLAKNIGVLSTPTCLNQFGDTYGREKPGACTLNIATYTTAGEVSVVNAQRMNISIVLTGEVSDWFSNGMLTWTSGDNNGMSVPVKKHEVDAGETLEFALPTFLPIQVGDTFDVIAGCDKTWEECVAKFNNGINFDGHPFMNPGITRR